ncbi:MAG: hypothetical protein ACE144_17765 [Thermodesulfobacteriota bacterium]
MKERIVLLTDYRGHFYSSVRYKEANMDIPLLKNCFAEEGYDLVVYEFAQVDFRTQNFDQQFVLYQSSEDRNLFYKSYVEDILLGLQLQGAILVPDFYCFRAHHNKVFMEVLRDLNTNPGIKNLHSKAYGTFEEFSQLSRCLDLPVVIKSSSGCASTGVELIRTDGEARRIARKLSSSLHPIDALKDVVKSYVRKRYDRRSNHRRKFIIQNCVPNLANDYKILIYGEKYYALYRQTRPKDFRASGSGLFKYVEDLPDGLLEFSESIFNSFQTPYISLDIASNRKEFFLLEFQFVHFGTYTIEKAPFYFSRKNNGWVARYEKSILEREFARSVAYHLNRLKHDQLNS